VHRAGLKKAATLSSVRPLQLNLGSGFHPKAGWINIDLIDGRADLQLDLREQLPFADNSVAHIYTEHFFEHLDFANADDSTSWELDTPRSPSDALTLLRECRRVLVPGGRLDVVVPDAEAILHAYAARRSEPFKKDDWWGPSWCDTPMHLVNYLFRQGSEHQYAYDFETLRHTLTLAGFTDVRRREFDPSVDAENHRIGSLCVVAVK